MIVMANYLKNLEASQHLLTRWATIGLASSMVIFGAGCVNAAQVGAHDKCEAVSSDGVVIHPKAYPIGKISVGYFYRNNNQTIDGTIETSNGGYRLDVKGLPPQPDTLSVFLNSKGVGAAVSISSVVTGEIGFTSGCITLGVDANNIPTSFVELPISS